MTESPCSPISGLTHQSLCIDFKANEVFLWFLGQISQLEPAEIKEQPFIIRHQIGATASGWLLVFRRNNDNMTVGGRPRGAEVWERVRVYT